MKLLPVEYLGSTTMERRFSNPMLPWIIAEIRRRNTVDKICVGVEEGMVQAYDTNFEQQFDHKLALMVRLSHVCNSDANSFIYILRDSNKPLLHCHLFRATRNEDVQELFKQMKEQGALAGHSGGNTSPKYSGPTRSVSSAANLTSLCADISPSSSHFFEVLYIGKIKVSQKKIPDTFIDDALCKFQAHEQGKLKAKTISQLKQGTQQNDSRRGSQDSTISDFEPTEINAIQPIHNPVLLSPLTPLEPVKAFVPRSNSQQDITDKDASSKRAAYSNVTGRTRTISEGSDTGIKIETTATSLDLDDTCTELSNQTKPMLIPKSVPDSFSASYKEISKSFDNASHLSEHNIAAARLGTSIGSGIAGRKCGSIEALPTLAEDEKKFSLTQHLKGSLMRDRSSSIGHGPTARPLLRKQDSTEHNRTMVFQVGRTDLRLISPDRKQILLHKQLRDVVSCIQGVKSTEHFGFICREPSNEFFMGYIFKCQSNSVSIEVVQAITQAFHATAEALKHPTRPALMSCEHCPMVWYHRLCAEIESQGDRKTQAIIFRKISCLDEEEQAVILTKFKGAETDSTREQNEFLMMLLRAHCEAKQNRHVHDTAENRSEFLNQYLGGSTIFMKAKRSLTNSFDHLLKRKGSNNDFGHSRELSLPVSRENSPHPQTLEVPECNFSPVACRSRTSTISSLNGDDKSPSTRTSPEHIDSKDEKNGTYLKSPMMDIFFKVGSSPKSDNTDSKTQRASWRQEMFNRVVTPNKTDMVPETEPRRKRTREELRKLWKKSINQALLLVRMEKENARLKARQEESAVKRIKLEYDEINPCHRELMDIWELLVSKESRISTKCDTQMLLQAIRQGVPRSKRGDVWHFLAEQFCIKQPPIDTANFPNFNTPYEQLLTQLTSHQHAILIDLGRTFPNHTYFSSSLGPGQLALFNLLKAYSLLDPEVGYCQGLSFVAGVLLLHMSEDEAFYLLRHLMFRRGLRSQYLPDMVALQVHLYQLSRLLHDQIPELYEHFNTHEVAPTLYAAPWVLTIFASQFPLGFVTRVFDLLFLENQDVIFKVAIALLNYHKENLLACDCFEDIMDYLRNTVPSIDRIAYDKVMNQVFHTDISKQMNEYQVEYHVLQEEMASVRPQLDSLAKLEQQNKTLVEQNQNLSEQLQMVMSNAQRLETTRAIHQGTVNRLEAQVRSLEVTVETLGSFINQIIESKIDIEIPGDVRRIVAQIALSEKRMNARMATNSTNNPPPKKFEPQKNMVKSLSMSRLGLNFNRNKEELVPRSHSVNIGLGNSLVQNLKQTENEKHNSILNTVNENLSKIEDKGHRGFPLRVIEDDTPYEPMKTQSLKTIPPLKSTLSQPSMGNKTGFFANSHNHIQQQRMQYLALKQGTSPEKNNDSNLVRNMTEGSNKILTDAGKLEPIKQVSLNTNFIKLDDPLDISNNLIEKSVSLPLETINSFKSDNLSKSDSNNESKDSSVDSGISTPLSPSNERTINEIPLYDSDINFTFNGTTQLRSIKPVAKVGKTQH